MNLRESMLAAAEDAPLAESSVDLDRLVGRERRSAGLRRTGLALVVAVAAALAVPALWGGGTHPSERAAGSDPPVAGSAPVDPAPALRLTAADLRRYRDGSDGILMIRLRSNSPTIDALAGNPCVLPDGATPGRDLAPALQDRCTRIEKDGLSAWVRRWGYSPGLRPWMTPDSVVIDVFLPLNSGRTGLLTMANGWMSAPAGPRFEVSDAEIAEFILGADFISRR